MMNRLEVEKHLNRVEHSALEPYTQYVYWYGIQVNFKRCAKRDGGNIKRNSVWGKLTYTNGFTGQNMNRDEAIEFALTPLAVRDAKLALLNQCICDICGKKGTYDRHQWGYLNYLGHPMKICPDCIKNIYDKSPKPWEHN